MFDYFVSLGMSFPLAASMSKYGLRSFSGPFDWLITEDFSWVMHFIETDFESFLQQENLVSYENNTKKFIDKRNGFVFLHDRLDFKHDFSTLQQKYSYLTNRLIEASSKKICFLRAVMSQNELDYIKDHAQYIQSTIKKHNKESEIVFLLSNGMQIPKGMPFRYYCIPKPYGGTTEHSLRSWFDGATDFLDFCGDNYSGRSLLKNIAIDREKDEKITALIDRRYRILTTLLSYDFEKCTLPERTIIYGAGRLGQQLCVRIQDLTRVEYFIDRSKCGTEFRGVPIVDLKTLRDIHAASIIVSTSYDFETIRENIWEHLGREISIISIDEIIGLKL